MKSGFCKRAAALAAAVSLWASPAMAQTAGSRQISEAQENEIYCVSDKLSLVGEEVYYGVAEVFLYGDNSAEQAKRVQASFKRASDACAAKYKWDATKQTLGEKIALYSSVSDYLAEELCADGVKEEQIDLIFTALGKLPVEDLPRFLDQAWTEDAEFTKRVHAALAAEKYPDDDAYVLETAGLIMEVTVLATVGISDWVRMYINK